MKMSKKSITILVLFIFLSCIFLAISGGYTVIKSVYKLRYESSVKYWAEEYSLDPYLVCSVIWTESKFDKEAESSVGAIGLMQIMPETGEWIADKLDLEDYHTEMLYEEDVNIRFGCWYLRFLLDRFEVTETACAAYNAGQNKVSDWLDLKTYSSDGKTLDVIPYEETAEYVERIKKAYEIYHFFYTI